MNSESVKTVLSNCPNSKIDIKANSYNKTKVFNVQDSVDKHLSRVDSRNDPDTTDNLDNIARKMGFNQENNNSVSTLKVKLNKLDRCSEEKLNENEISKSFHVTNDKPPDVNINNKATTKKSGFMSNIIRRLSISTPKMLSKKKKNKRSKHKNDAVDSKADVINGNGQISCEDKTITMVKSNDTHTDSPQKSNPHSKHFKNIFQKFVKRKGKAKVTSEPPSSIESRPSLSSVANHGLNYETTTSCNDIYLNKISPIDFQTCNNCASADCIVNYAKQKKLIKHQESTSSTSEDLIEQEAKLNAGINPIIHDTLSDEFPDLDNQTIQVVKDNISPLSIKTTEFKFESQRSCQSTMSGAYHTDTSNNVKLTLALYGYSNYGLSSSRLASKSCMEFRSATNPIPIKLSMDNVSINKVSRVTKSNGNPENNPPEKEIKVDEEIISPENENVEVSLNSNADQNIENDHYDENDCLMKESDPVENNENSSVVLRKIQRPNDIKLRKSREPSQNLVARSSMIMLVVSHNSPRNKTVSNQLSTPNKDLDLNTSLNGSIRLSANIPTKSIFDNFSIKDPKSPGIEANTAEEKSEIQPNLDMHSSENTCNQIENDNNVDQHEVYNGCYFLNLVHKHENEILAKVDTVQNYLDTENLTSDEEVYGQLLVTVGKAKLLLSEKMLQFKGLCEKNIKGIIEENELPTLLSDLNGFWDMVYGQIEDVHKNFELVEKIRANDWKMIPYEANERPSTSTPRSKRTTSKLSVGSSKKISTPNSQISQNKNTSTNTPTRNKFSSADKRKNIMQFKLNQRANMAQNADPNFSNDILFY